MRDGPMPGWLGASLGRVLAPVYAWEVGRRNRRFDAGVGVERLPVRVVSIGNLTVGGTGKTPMVRWAVDALRDAGARPAIAMRGYRARGGESDEAAEYAGALPGVPVVAQPDRAAGVRDLLAGGADVDVVVLDDGFQHRRLARDVDVVLIDCSRPLASLRCLPAGWGREPMASLARADAVVLTHAERAGDAELAAMRTLVAHHAPSAVVAVCEHAWGGVRGGDDDMRDVVHDVAWLDGRRVVVACAIGNPGAFVSQVRDAGAEVVERVVLRDHDAFGAAVVGRIAAAARDVGTLVVTEKDWVKLRKSAAMLDGIEVVRPVLAMRFRAGEEGLRRLVVGEASA